MIEWITVSEASRKVNVSDRTIRNWIAKGKIIGKKEKGLWLIDNDSLSEIGKASSDDGGKSERVETVSVPLEHYDGLTTRVGQLEAENNQYRLMLKAHDDEVDKLQKEATEANQAREAEVNELKKEMEELRGDLEYQRRPWYRRWLKRRKEEEMS